MTGVSLQMAKYGSLQENHLTLEWNILRVGNGLPVSKEDTPLKVMQPENMIDPQRAILKLTNHSEITEGS